MTLDLKRVALIRNVAKLSSSLSLGDINLLMRGLGLTEIAYQSWNDDPDGRWFVGVEDRQDFLKSHLDGVSQSKLTTLAEACRQILGSETQNSPLPDPDAPLTLFASHLASEKATVKNVANALRDWGVHMFVAHESIEPSEDWQLEIEKSLKSVDGAIAFIHQQFNESKWCSQEMGWARGRDIPLLLLLFDENLPAGFLGKIQGQKIPSHIRPDEIAELIVKWAGKFPELKSRLQVSAVEGFCASKSFKMTDLFWAKILSYESLTAKQIENILHAIKTNDQISGANCKAVGSKANYGRPYSKVILEHLVSLDEFSGQEAKARDVARFLGLSDFLEALLVPF